MNTATPAISSGRRSGSARLATTTSADDRDDEAEILQRHAERRDAEQHHQQRPQLHRRQPLAVPDQRRHASASGRATPAARRAASGNSPVPCAPPCRAGSPAPARHTVMPIATNSSPHQKSLWDRIRTAKPPPAARKRKAAPPGGDGAPLSHQSRTASTSGSLRLDVGLDHDVLEAGGFRLICAVNSAGVMPPASPPPAANFSFTSGICRILASSA